MSRSLFLSHLLPAATSSTIAGIVNYGLFEPSFRGAGIGALAGLVYSATHDILRSKKSENSFINHSMAILTSAILTYGVSAAAAAAGLIAMPTLAVFGALFATAIIINAITRVIFKPHEPEPDLHKKIPPVPPAQQPVKQDQAVPQPKQQPVPPAIMAAAVQPTAAPAPTPPAAPPQQRPQPAAVKAPALPQGKPQTTLPPAPPQPPPAPPSQPVAKNATPAPVQPVNPISLTLDELLASPDFKNCTEWLSDFKNIEPQKWIHKSADKGRFVITASGYTLIPLAQRAANFVNKHTPEKLAKDLQETADIYERTLTAMVSLFHSSNDKTNIEHAIQMMMPNIQQAINKLALLKATYQSDSHVPPAVDRLTQILTQKHQAMFQAVLTTAMPFM